MGMEIARHISLLKDYDYETNSETTCYLGRNTPPIHS